MDEFYCSMSMALHAIVMVTAPQNWKLVDHDVVVQCF